MALVTGANTGIGKVTARALALRGAHVFIACRSRERTEPVLAEIRTAAPQAQIEAIPLDLGDLASVRICAAELLGRGLPLHLLVNNAGVAPHRGDMSASGFELAFGVNHMGHFLLTALLLERLRESAPSRIVTVASEAHRGVRGMEWDALRRPTASATGFAEYSRSKLANVLFSAELGRRLAGSDVTTYALHPGVVASDIWRGVPAPLRALIKLFMITPERGAKTTIHCATSVEAGRETALYYERSKIKAPSAVAQDAALARELWQRSEEWSQQGA
ncbi:MAG: family oxidoreductase [Acidobacteria bacterium]|nr:family oxidoreductase [Acidobacteriota bacterium]